MTKEEILNGMSEQEFYSLYPTREAWEQVQQQMAYGGMPNIMGIPFGAGVIMEAGGAMTQDLEGQYPSFGYGGYDSPFNYGQFPGMAHGGNTTSQGGNQDFLNNRNNTYLNYIQNNVLKNIQQEESEKVQNAFMQMENSYRMGGAPCYECGGYHMQGGGSYDMLNQQNLALQNMYGQQMQQYQDQHAQDRAAFANLFLPQAAEGAQQPDHGALLHQFAEEFGPRSRRTGLPLFPANLSPYYQIGKKDAAKLAGLPKNFKMEGLEITPKWGLGARTAMNIGNLFRSKENDRTTPGWAPKSIHYKFTGKRGYMPGEPRPDTHETVQQSAIGPKTTYDQANPYGPIPAGTTQASVPYLPSSIRPGYNASGKMINEKYPGLTPSYISSSSQFNTMAYGGDYFDGGGNYPTLFGTQNNPIDLKGSTTNQWSFAGQQSAPTPTAAGVYGKPALSIDTRNQTEDSPYVQGSQVQYDAAKDRSNEDITVEGDIDKKWKGIRETIGQYAIPTLNFVSSGLENKNYKKFKKKMEASMLADNAFVTTPLNAKNRGDYDINSGILRSDDYVPVQFPGYAQWGGFNTMAVGGSYEKDQELRQAQSGLEVKMNPGLYGTNGNSQFNKSAHLEAGKISQQPTEVRQSLTAVPREKANLEAEGGETAVVNVDGIPAHFKISGPRHTNGGVPLDLPDNSFIFSDTAKMKIKDPNILAQFGMKPKRGGYTPADIAKKYDINKFRKILADPNTDDMQRKTAEMMIANYNEKLAKLALAQESVKGFPQGIPVIAMPYIENMQMNPATFLPDQAQEQLEGAEQPDADMGTARYGSQVINQFPIKRYGGLQYSNDLPMAQNGFDASTVKGWMAGLLNILEAPQRAMMYAGTGMFGDQNYEMINPKTGQKEWVDEDNMQLKKRQGYTYTGETKKAFYEMPGESLKRNYPESSPYLQGAADIFADPLLVAGIAKTGARLATKKLIKETADAVASGTMKGLTKEEMVNQIIKKAGKQATEKNINIVSKSIDAGADALLKNQGKGSIKQVRAIEKAVTKTAGRARQVEDLKVIGKEIPKGAKEFKEVVPEMAAEAYRLGKKGVKKGRDIAETVGDFVAGPYAGPITIPIIKNLPRLVKPAIYQEQVEEQKKEIEKLKKRIAESNEGKYIPNVEGKYWTHTKKPGKFVYDMNLGKYIPMNTAAISPADTAGISQFINPADTVGISQFINAPRREYGGDLNKYKFGDEFKGNHGKFTQQKNFRKYEDGTVTFIKNGKELIHTDGDPNWKPNIEIKKNKPAGTQGTRMSVGARRVNDAQGYVTNPGEAKKRSQDLTESATADAEGNIPIIIRPYYGSDNPTAYTPEQWQEFARSTGFKPKTKSVGAQNREFQDYLAAHPDWKNTIDELHQKHGRPKEGKFDAMIGRRWDVLMQKKPAPEKLPEETPAPKITIAPEERKNTTVPPQVIKRNSPVPVKGGTYAPWWLQDIVKTSGAAADLARVNRYLPWQATPEVRLPDATFYDPTRELAANAEQANIQTQGLAAFTGPQALSARSSSIQGQAAKNAADIMARYNNMNVELANQLNQERTSIMNTASQNKAALDTQLFDKYTIVNQQFDNAKNMARQNLRQSYIDAITNRAKTQALNTLYPNYYTDPSRGGMLGFAPDFSKIPAEQPNDSDEWWDAVGKTGSKELAIEYLKLKNKGAISDPYDERRGYMGAQGYGE